MKMAKQILASLLCLCMVAAMLPAIPAAAADFAVGDTRVYDFSDVSEFNSKVNVVIKAEGTTAIDDAYASIKDYNTSFGRYWKWLQTNMNHKQVMFIPDQGDILGMNSYGDAAGTAASNLNEYTALAIDIPAAGTYATTLSVHTANNDGAIMDVYLMPNTAANLTAVTNGAWTTTLNDYLLHDGVNMSNLDGNAVKYYTSSGAYTTDTAQAAYTVPAKSSGTETATITVEKAGEYILAFKKNVNSVKTENENTESTSDTINRVNMFVNSLSLKYTAELPDKENTGVYDFSDVSEFNNTNTNVDIKAESTTAIKVAALNDYNKKFGRYWKYLQTNMNHKQVMFCTTQGDALALYSYSDAAGTAASNLNEYTALAIDIAKAGKYQATLSTYIHSNGAIADVYLIPNTAANLAAVTNGEWTTTLNDYLVYGAINTNSSDTAAKYYTSAGAVTTDAAQAAYTVPAKSSGKDVANITVKKAGEYILAVKKNLNSVNTADSIVRIHTYIQKLELDYTGAIEKTAVDETKTYTYDFKGFSYSDYKREYSDNSNKEITLVNGSTVVADGHFVRSFDAAEGRNWRYLYSSGTQKRVWCTDRMQIGTYSGYQNQYSAFAINVPAAGEYDFEMNMHKDNYAAGMVFDAYLIPMTEENLEAAKVFHTKLADYEQYRFIYNRATNQNDTEDYAQVTADWSCDAAGEYILIFLKGTENRSDNAATYSRTYLTFTDITLTRTASAAKFGNAAVYLEKDASGNTVATIISAIDSLNYAGVGFSVAVGDAGAVTVNEAATKVYKSVAIAGTDASGNTVDVNISAVDFGLTDNEYVFIQTVNLGSIASGEKVTFTPYAIDVNDIDTVYYGKTFQATKG